MKQLMKEVVQAQKAKKSQKWLARILGGIPSPMLIVSKLGYIKVCAAVWLAVCGCVAVCVA